MPRSVLTRAIAGVVLAAGLLAACSGGSTPAPSGSGASPSHNHSASVSGSGGTGSVGSASEAMTGLMNPAIAEQARQRSAELRGLLDEVTREHGINRALMRQELAFLDHLVRLLAKEPDTGYRPGGPTTAPSNHHVLNLQA